jgi:cytochrome P450
MEHGTHRCPAAALDRLESRTALDDLAARYLASTSMKPVRAV